MTGNFKQKAIAKITQKGSWVFSKDVLDKGSTAPSDVGWVNSQWLGKYFWGIYPGIYLRFG